MAYKKQEKKPGAGKSAWRDYLKKHPAFGAAFIDGRLSQEVTMIDAMVGIKGMPMVNESGTPVLADDFVNRIKAQIKFGFDGSSVVCLIMDKSVYVPIMKAPTQEFRSKEVAIPDAVPLTAVNAEKLAESRDKKLDMIEKRDAQQKVVEERGFVIKRGHPLPQPWDRYLYSKHRDDIVRFLVCALMDDSLLAFSPPEGCSLFIDGHCMLLPHYPPRHNPHPKMTIKDLDAAVKTLQYTTPLEFKHPKTVDGVQPAGNKAMTDDELAAMMFEAADEADCGENKSVVLPRVFPAINFTNKLGEFDVAFLHYITVFMCMYGYTSYNINSVDTDIPINCIWFLYRWRNMRETFTVPKCMTEEVVDGEVVAVPEDLARERMKQLPVPSITISYGKGLLSTNILDIDRLYNDLVVWFGGKEEYIPSLITAIISASSDYTFGYHGVSVKTFTETYLNLFEHIGPLVRFRSTSHGPIAEVIKANYRELLKCAYTNQHIAKVTKCRDPKFADMATYSLEDLRDFLERLVVAKQYIRVYDHEEDGDEWRSRHVFELFLRSIYNRIPNDTEIENRRRLVSGWVLVLNQMGNSNIVFGIPSDYGYAKKDKNKPWSRTNIKMCASFDYEGWTERREQRFLMRGMQEVYYKDKMNFTTHAPKPIAVNPKARDSDDKERKQKKVLKRPTSKLGPIERINEEDEISLVKRKPQQFIKEEEEDDEAVFIPASKRKPETQGKKEQKKRRIEE